MKPYGLPNRVMSELMAKIFESDNLLKYIYYTGKEHEDIDIFSPKKFEELKRYLNKYNLKGGFVRFDKQSEELCICIDNYNEDIHSNDWKILSEVFK